MDDPIKKIEGKEKGDKSISPTANKRRQQVIAAAGVIGVLIAYMAYRKMSSGKSGGQAATGSPEGVNPPTTATDVPSGEAAPTTTVPFAAPTDTTGGGTIQTGSSTNAPAGANSTKAQGPQPTPDPDKVHQAQVKSLPAPYPAGHPALIKPLAPVHPEGKADAGLPGASDYPFLKSPVHPLTKAAPPPKAPAKPIAEHKVSPQK